MDISHLLTSTVTVTRVSRTAVVDPAGVLGTTTSTVRYRGHLQQSRTREETGGQEFADSDWNLYLEPAAAGDVDANDRVTIDGDVYQIDGQPWSVRNARTAVISHVECRLRRTH